MTPRQQQIKAACYVVFSVINWTLIISILMSIGMILSLLIVLALYTNQFLLASVGIVAKLGFIILEMRLLPRWWRDFGPTTLWRSNINS